jgi:hypothetical protein
MENVQIENIKILADMVYDILDNLPEEKEPTAETFKLYGEVGNLLLDLSKRLRYKGFIYSELHQAYLCGDYATD